MVWDYLSVHSSFIEHKGLLYPLKPEGGSVAPPLCKVCQTIEEGSEPAA